MALRLLVLVAALVFLVRGVGWRDIAVAVGRAGPWAPAVVVALNACMMGIRALRLRILLQRKLSFRSAFAALLTSSALNNIAPLRGGNVARLWMIERDAGVSKAAALAIQLVENLVEVPVLAAMAFVASCFVTGQSWASLSAPVVCVAAVALLVMLRLGYGRMTGSAGPEASAASGVRARLRRFAARLEPGFRALSQSRALASTLLLSFLAWTCEVVMVVVCAGSMGIAISFWLAIIVILGINFALALPSTPAGAGPFEGATVAVLMLGGIAKAPALGFALFYHAVQVIPVTLAGVTVLLLARRRNQAHVPRTMAQGEPALALASPRSDGRGPHPCRGSAL